MQDTNRFHPIAQKLLRPDLHEDAIARPRLLERLSRSRARIVTITAHAGFGKTVLLRQLTDATQQPVVWLHLDAYDNDQTTFWRYLVAGFQGIYPDFGKDILSLFHNPEDTSSTSRTVLSMMLNELSRYGQRITLAFDDCHVISESSVTAFMRDLLHYLPSTVMVLIAGREEVVELNKLHMSGELLKIDEADLCFTPEEVEACFARKGICLTALERDEIVKSTGGWPLAISLCIDAPEGEARNIADKKKTSLFSYMASEILGYEEEELVEFMIAIAVLEEITPEYCNLLLNRQDSQVVLKIIKSKYSFLTSYENREDSLRYHQLFREFCLQELGASRKGLMEKAGLAALTLGDAEAAVEYFLAAPAQERARKLIAQEGMHLLRRGNRHTVARWLNLFPEAEISADPWLSLYRAQLEISQGHINAADNWTNHAFELFTHTNDRMGLSRSYVIRAKIMRYQGRFEDSLAFLESAYPELWGTQSEGHYLYLEKSFILIMCGRFAEAEGLLQGALEEVEGSGNRVLLTHFYEGLGTLYYAWGYPDRSLQYFRRGIAISPDKTLNNCYFQDAIGPIHQDWGDLGKALEYLQQSVSAKENLEVTEALPSAYYQLGLVLLDLGELHKAEEYFQKALTTIDEHGGDRFVLALTNLMLAACMGAQGRFAEAQALVELARTIAQNQSEYTRHALLTVEAILQLQAGNVAVAYPLLQKIASVMERIGARKPLCVAYSLLALIGMTQEVTADVKACAEKALVLAAGMNYTHDLILSFGTYQPLVYLGLEQGTETGFLQRILVRVGEASIPLLQRVASHPDSAVRLRAIRPLMQIGGTTALDVLKTLIADDNREVAREAQATVQRQQMYHWSREWERSAMHLELLGPVRMYSAQRDVTNMKWIRNKSRDLLVYLAHSGNPVDKDKILEALWPSVPYQQANSQFHTTMHNLRRVMEEETGQGELVTYRGGRYCFLPDRIHVDKESFQQLLAGVRVSSNEELTESLVALLEEAVALYRGDYLMELDYTWILPEQEYLRQLHTRARDRLGQYYLSQQRYPEAIIHLERLVRDNPLTDEYYLRLMTAYGALGDTRTIHLLYQRLRQALWEELDLKPSRTIEDLYSHFVGKR